MNEEERAATESIQLIYVTEKKVIPRRKRLWVREQNNTVN